MCIRDSVKKEYRWKIGDKIYKGIDEYTIIEDGEKMCIRDRDNATTYAIITTDENGRATTPYLPHGEYLVKETKTPKDYITAPDFTISVTDDYTEYEDIEQIKIININNRPFTSQLKLVKIDEETGKTVTLNGASFKIKDLSLIHISTCSYSLINRITSSS